MIILQNEQVRSMKRQNMYYIISDEASGISSEIGIQIKDMDIRMIRC